MQSERRVGCGVALLIVDEQRRVLAKRRRGSHGDGTWGLVGGWMEHGESFLQAAQREALEEADLSISGYSSERVVNSYFPSEDVHSVTVCLLVEPHHWTGTPKSVEPHKMYGDWEWIDVRTPPTPLFQPLAECLKIYGDYLETGRIARD